MCLCVYIKYFLHMNDSIWMYFFEACCKYSNICLGDFSRSIHIEQHFSIARRSLAVSGDIFGGYKLGGSHRHLVGRGQGCSQTSHNAQGSPWQRIIHPNVSNAEVRNPDMDPLYFNCRIVFCHLLRQSCNNVHLGEFLKTDVFVPISECFSLTFSPSCHLSSSPNAP